MTSESNTSRPSVKPSTSKSGMSASKKITPDQMRIELDKLMASKFFTEFKKSDRARHLYNGYGQGKGDKIQVRFDGRNFKIIVGKPSTAVALESTPLGNLNIAYAEKRIRQMLAVF
jgi:hypothetical protein